MKTFKSIYNQDDRYYIDWDFDFKCNYKCIYCYQLEENILNTKILNHKSKINIVLEWLSNLDKDFTLGLLGGEPTISNYYFDILNKLNSIFEYKKNSECYISTNFSQIETFYKNHPKIKNTHIWISIHPEYFKEESLNYIKYIRDFIDNDKDIILSPMLYYKNKNTLKLFDLILDFFNKNKNTLKLKYSAQFIYKNQTKKLYFPELENYNFNSEKEFIFNNKKIEYNKLLKYPKFLNFKNWECNANYFYIKENVISNECLEFKSVINKNLKLPNTIVKCKYNQCIDYPMLLSKKVLT